MARTTCRRLLLAALLVLAVGLFDDRGGSGSGGQPAGPDAAAVSAREADQRYLRLDPAVAATMGLDELARIYDTPTKVWYLLERTATYAYDRDVWDADEYFATAEEFWARKQGDCEDWAAFAKALLDRAGYTTVLFTAWRAERDAGGNDGHTVVAVLENGRWNHLSNLGYIRAEATTHEELAASIFANWTRSNTWVYTGPTRTRDGLNGWRVAEMIANRGTGARTLVRADGPQLLLPASGN
ncbi:MAG TPA: transglutaminase-like domain-containing protein [Thermodesulfobacteriota bacterium]|nr:transglutaminase-like domain-containing protein [Thermodesulfobacteriota bacterium]